MDQGREPSSWEITLFAFATGALVANLYYAQPLIAEIAPAIGVNPELAGSISAVTQVGYGLGLFFLVSLADLVENRRLVLITVGLTGLGLIGAATATSAAPFFLSCLVIGVCSTAAQVLVPLVAHLVPLARRGRVLGNVMAGLLTGIMLARPLALFLSANFGWRAVFWVSLVLMVGLGLALARTVPRHQPESRLPYRQILISTVTTLSHYPAVRWRAGYQALMFGAFNLFWTTAPLMLAERFGLSQSQIGLFALAGCGGALAAPLAGRLADRGLTRVATGGAMALLGLSFLGMIWAEGALALGVLVLLTIALDGAVQLTHVTGQRVIFAGPAANRGRANAIYMTIVFAGGTLGSLLGPLLYHGGGWAAVAGAGAVIGAGLLGLLWWEGEGAE